ncbi:extracellular solute-binding protein [Arcanobacterium hippocoleae]
MKKAIALISTMLLSAAALTACSGGEKTESASGDLPKLTFTHGYFHDESEWAPAAEMRKIYDEFAQAHKDEFVFEAVADSSGGEGIYNSGLNKVSAGEFYDIADFGGYDIVPVASSAGLIMDLKPYLDEDSKFKAGVGVAYDQNLTKDGKIYSVREQIEGVGFWYNQKLFEQAGAAAPDQWKSWADFDTAVEKLVSAGISPFSLNAGWTSSILSAGYLQNSKESRDFYAKGGNAESFGNASFKDFLNFMQNRVLSKIDAAHFGSGADEDRKYVEDFTSGDSAMLFEGVWASSDLAGAKAGAENLKPALFPTNDGKKAGLLSGGTGFVVSDKLTDEQKEIAIKFIKYMTSPEIAARIVEKGIGMAPSSSLDYSTIKGPDAASKLMIAACNLLQSADIKALGFGNTFGDMESEILSKYAGLKDGSSARTK